MEWSCVFSLSGVRVQVEQRRVRGVPVQLPHQRGGAGGVQRAALRPPGVVHQRAAGLQDGRVQHGDGELAVGAGEDDPRGRLLVAVVQRGHQLAGRPRLHQGRPGGAAQHDVGQVRLPVVHHLVSHGIDPSETSSRPPRTSLSVSDEQLDTAVFLYGRSLRADL